ncbi:MAG: response regulator [Candidatus Rokubacteria bacterium]|nr:response regulator [Candidatus Rokubacteria bacterium]
MVYGIIKQSGGQIWVDSEPGRGATFTILLPRVEEAAEAPQPHAPAVPPPRGRETILLVEDERVVRALARDILLMSGYTVLEASHGKEALAVSERHKGPIDMMLTDVVMPNMNGRELYDRLAPLRPGLKVLYMSGYAESGIVRDGALEAGTAFIPKPFTVDALAAKVREVLDGSRNS